MDNKSIEKFFQDTKNVFTMVRLKEYLKLPVYAYVICFIIGIIIPIISVMLNPGKGNVAVPPEMAGFDTSFEWLEIITNNIRVLFTLFITGIILYVGPLFGIGFNALVHGLFLGVSVQESGMTGLVRYVLLMAPHGIFEVPALLFSAGAGVLLSRTLLNFIMFKWFNASKLYEAFLLIFIAFCFFLIASVIETQITFRILDVFISPSGE